MRSSMNLTNSEAASAALLLLSPDGALLARASEGVGGPLSTTEAH
jgi:hypothetical protein